MAQAVLFGTDASLTTSGFGNKYNAFTCNISQGITEAYGFGDTYVTRRGTILGATGEVAGFTSKGTTADAPGLASFTRAGATLTLTFSSGCTLAFTAILSGLTLGVQFLGTQTSGYSFASSGTITETWVTS